MAGPPDLYDRRGLRHGKASDLPDRPDDDTQCHSAAVRPPGRCRPRRIQWPIRHRRAAGASAHPAEAGSPPRRQWSRRNAWVELRRPPMRPGTAAVLDSAEAALAARRREGPSRLEALRAALGTRGVDALVVAAPTSTRGEGPAPPMPSGCLLDRPSPVRRHRGQRAGRPLRRRCSSTAATRSQAGHQVDGERWEIVSSVKTPVVRLAGQALSPGARPGLRPKAGFRSDQGKAAFAARAETGGRPLAARRGPNPIVRPVGARPPAPAPSSCCPNGTGFAGESPEDSGGGLAEDLAARRIDAAVLTQPESIALGSSTCAAATCEQRRCAAMRWVHD